MSDRIVEAALNEYTLCSGPYARNRIGFERGARWFSSELLSDAVVEAAAKAMCSEVYKTSFEEVFQHPYTRSRYIDLARAAILAAINAVQSPENGANA